MAKFCTKCGAALDDGRRFCKNCGAPIADDSGPPGSVHAPAPAPMQQMKRQGAPAAGANHLVLLLGGAAALLVLLILAGAGYAFYAYQNSSAQEPQASPVQVEQQESEKGAHSSDNAAVPAKDILQASREELESYGEKIDGDILASSYGHSEDGFLAVKKSSRAMIFLLLDRKNHRVLTCYPVNMSLREFAKRREQRNPAPLIVRFGAYKPNLGKDEDKGKWEHFNHHMDILANYEYDGSGKLVYGMQYSGRGLHHESYDVPLYEQQHVDMMNLFLAEAYELYTRSQGTPADEAMDLFRK